MRIDRIEVVARLFVRGPVAMKPTTGIIIGPRTMREEVGYEAEEVAEVGVDLVEEDVA